MSAPREERWRVLTRQLARENDPVRFMGLGQELLGETDRRERKAAISSGQEDRMPHSPFGPYPFYVVRRGCSED